MIEAKIVDIPLDGLTIGRIISYPGADSLFLFDTKGLEMRQISLSPDLKVIGTLSVKDKAAIQQMDTVFFDTQKSWMMIADSLAKKLFKFTLEFSGNILQSISLVGDVPLSPGTIITAAVVLPDEYVLLDKGNSMIRGYNKDLVEMYTVGSRMGYISEYADQQGTRLGFEFPEDMVAVADGMRLVVADSGNKRLVVLHRERREAQERRSENCWVQEKIITMPEYPFKILGWDKKTDSVIVSDFDRSWQRVSFSHGFVCQDELTVAVDFYPVIYNYGETQGIGYAYCASESNQLVELIFNDTSLEKSASMAGNWLVLLKICLEQKRVPEARQLVVEHGELLPEYVKYGLLGDDYFKDELQTFVEKTFRASMVANQVLSDEIVTLAHQFIIKYKSIPESQDMEAAHIDKENIRHNMFLKLKQFRTHLYKIAELNAVVKHYPAAKTLLLGVLNTRFEIVKVELLEQAARIEKNLLNFDELDMLKAIVEYWLFSEEEAVVFRERNYVYPKLFGENFILAILKDFYYQIGLLFLARHKIAEYIKFIDREITMYSDKVGIFNSFINQLISLGKYDDVFRMLNKMPDRNKENVNYFLYRVYLGQGDKDNAFLHLKKELELYPHRMNLIPDLIRLGKLSPEESQGFIDKILNTSGQSIDLYLNVARAYQSIENYERAEFYVDRELQLFPENKSALLLKMECFNRFHTHLPSTDYFWKTWEIFKGFLKSNRGENTVGIEPFILFFRVLNHVEIDAAGIKELIGLRDSINVNSFKKELNAYLSFLIHCLQKNSQNGELPALERYDAQVYLSSYATRTLAYDFFLARATTLKNQGLWEEMFVLLENILKYNPGDKRVFSFLDALVGNENSG